MKNRLIVLLSAMLLASISTAAWAARPLDVITPNGGEKLVKATKYTIEWNNKGYGKGLKVKLELLVGKKKKVNRVIVKKTKNDGKYEWTIPSDAKFNKKTYSIRIVSVGPSGKRKHGHADISDGRFSIVKK